MAAALASVLACCQHDPSHRGDAGTTDAPDTAETSSDAPELADEEPVDPLLDTDEDTIVDLDEDGATGVDTDGDTVPDHLDLDSDDDTIPDAEEAGDSDPRTPPRDTDGDGTPDFRDLDSDGDGLPDAWERENGLSPYSEDSDLDGVPDLIEVEAGTDPLDATDTPGLHHWPAFIMPYNDPRWPQDVPIDPEPIVDYFLTHNGTGETLVLTTRLRDDPSDLVDPVKEFGVRVLPDDVGGRPDPDESEPPRTCGPGLPVSDLHDPLDRVPDSFTAVPPGASACFDVRVEQNWSVPALCEVQAFLAYIDVIGNGTWLLETVPVIFIVPPLCCDP